MVIFVAYEGFELIANAAPDIEKPKPKELDAEGLIQRRIVTTKPIQAYYSLTLPR